jgi:hypothetical protein
MLLAYRTVWDAVVWSLSLARADCFGERRGDRLAVFEKVIVIPGCNRRRSRLMQAQESRDSDLMVPRHSNRSG